MAIALHRTLTEPDLRNLAPCVAGKTHSTATDEQRVKYNSKAAAASWAVWPSSAVRSIDDRSAVGLKAAVIWHGILGLWQPKFDTNPAKSLICLEATLRRATTARTFERRARAF